MITLFNTINSISTSVTARIKQYGAMRAVGMDGNQFTRMIAEEAFTYSISGFVIGGVIGIYNMNGNFFIQKGACISSCLHGILELCGACR